MKIMGKGILIAHMKGYMHTLVSKILLKEQGHCGMFQYMVIAQ